MKKTDSGGISKGCGDEVKSCVYLYPGDYFFATEPTLIHTVLGSCVSVVLFDQIYKYGAMCHAVLDKDPGKEESLCNSKYMDCVLDEMFADFAERGISATRLLVKIFGGASLLGRDGLAAEKLFPGNKNISMAKSILKEYGCKFAGEDSGGDQGRKIYFCSHTGEVYLKRIRKI